MKNLFLLVSILLLTSCNQTKKQLTAQQIVDTTIEKACQGNCDKATVSFTFRDFGYTSIRNQGDYKYTRLRKDSIGFVRDELSNAGFKRFINEAPIIVADTTAVKISDAVNSVHYFSQLPYGLNAAAVKKELTGETNIKNELYFKIKVTFGQEGGGTDFDDEFLYWIHKTNFTVDYLAYSYATNGGGIRYREAYNPRVIEGIRFVDYNNYKPSNLEFSLDELSVFFEKGALKLLSKIETENVRVSILE